MSICSSARGATSVEVNHILGEAPPGRRAEAANLASRTWMTAAGLIRRFDYFNAYSEINNLPAKVREYLSQSAPNSKSPSCNRRPPAPPVSSDSFRRPTKPQGDSVRVEVERANDGRHAETISRAFSLPEQLRALVQRFGSGIKPEFMEFQEARFHIRLRQSVRHDGSVFFDVQLLADGEMVYFASGIVDDPLSTVIGGCRGGMWHHDFDAMLSRCLIK
jgi:hypothetical protein